MVVRLHNLTKWQLLAPGQVLEFHGEHSRRVRVEFNTEDATRLDVVHGDDDQGKVTFLATINGLEVVEFTAPGGSHLVATSEGEVWFFTNEGDQIATDREAVSFTRVMNRRARNPELERMMFKMEQNMNARLALMADEVAAQVAAAGVNHDPATGEVDDETTQDSDGSPDGNQGAPAGEQGGTPPPAGEGADAGSGT